MKVHIIREQTEEIKLDDIYVKGDKAFCVCGYGDHYYDCEVQEYNDGKIGKFLGFTHLEEHMFGGMEKINLSLREKIKSIEKLGHGQFLCFGDKKDVGTRNFKQEILFYISDFLTDDELKTLYKNKEVELTNGPYRYILKF